MCLWLAIALVLSNLGWPGAGMHPSPVVANPTVALLGDVPTAAGHEGCHPHAATLATDGATAGTPALPCCTAPSCHAVCVGLWPDGPPASTRVVAAHGQAASTPAPTGRTIAPDTPPPIA